MKLNVMKSLAVAALLAIVAVESCASTQAGELNVVGTGDGVDMLRAMAADFTTKHPETTVSIPPSIGSGGGIAAVGAGTEVLGRVARPLSDAERAQGIETQVVAKIPSAFYVHPAITVAGLTAQQLADIYAGEITSWAQVGGPDLKIKVVRRENADSTLVVLRGSLPGWKDLVITAKSKTALTTQDAVETVETVEGAIGFGPFSKGLERETHILKVDGRYPTDPSYPSAVTLSLIFKQATLTDAAKAFLAYANSSDARALIQSFGGVTVE